jgi:hypothetical protein
MNIDELLNYLKGKCCGPLIHNISECKYGKEFYPVARNWSFTGTDGDLTDYFSNMMKRSHRCAKYFAFVGSSGAGKTMTMLNLMQKFVAEWPNMNDCIFSIYMTASTYNNQEMQEARNAQEFTTSMINSMNKVISGELRKCTNILSRRQVMQECYIVLMLDEIPREFDHNFFITLSSNLKEDIKCKGLVLAVAGTDASPTILSLSSLPKEAVKIRMMPITNLEIQKSLFKLHLAKSIKAGKIDMFTKRCFDRIIPLPALMSNHRCAHFTVEAISDYHRQGLSISFSSLGPQITHRVALKYCAQNGLQRFTPDVRKRLLFYSLLLTSTQSVTDFVESSEIRYKNLRTLMTLGLIERAVEGKTEEDGQTKYFVSNKYEWEMSPALTLIAAAALVPSLMHSNSLGDMLEWISGLHMSLLYYLQTDIWCPVKVLDKQVPYATSAKDCYMPAISKACFINGRSAPYADVILWNPSDDENLEDNEIHEFLFATDKNLLPPDLVKADIKNTMHNGLKGPVSHDGMLCLAKFSAGVPKLDHSIELNKMGIVRKETDDVPDRKNYATGKALTDELFKQDPLIIFLTNKTFSTKGKDCVHVEGGKDEISSFHSLYPLRQLISSEVSCSDILAETKIFGEYDPSSDKVKVSKSES